MERLDQTNRVISRATMVNLKSLLVCDDRCPEVLTGQSLIHFPLFIQHRDQALLIYLANEMEAAFGDRQLFGQGTNLLRPQAQAVGRAVRLPRRRAMQRRRLVLLRVPLLKFRTGVLDRGQRMEMLSLP